MLTCKIGESIINCFDGKYDRYQLKQWSSKGIMKCPVCDGDYEYCHGEVVSPYFRHVGKDCEGHYHEAETEEHRKGKQLLYEWIKCQPDVENCQLEYWLPETKQRPDIYFEINEKKYVIEFQCSPIATEHLIRKELYELNGINDLWILGTEKYNINFEGSPRRIIEKSQGDRLIYLNPFDGKVVINIDSVNRKGKFLKSVFKGDRDFQSFFFKNKHLLNGAYFHNEYGDLNNTLWEFQLKNIGFNKENYEFTKDFLLNAKVEEENLNVEYQIHLTNLRIAKAKKDKFTSKINESIKSLNVEYFDCDHKAYCMSGRSDKYVAYVTFDNSLANRYYFMNYDKVDSCRKDKYRTFTKFHNLDSISSSDEDKLMEFLIAGIKSNFEEIRSLNKRIKEQEEERMSLAKDTFGEFLNSKIRLIHQGAQDVPEDMRFKFLKGFNISETYFRSKFVSELKFLKKKKVNEYVFMIPKYRSHYNTLGLGSSVNALLFNDRIINVFSNYGFNNVQFI